MGLATRGARDLGCWPTLSQSPRHPTCGSACVSDVGLGGRLHYWHQQATERVGSSLPSVDCRGGEARRCPCAGRPVGWDPSPSPSRFGRSSSWAVSSPGHWLSLGSRPAPRAQAQNAVSAWEGSGRPRTDTAEVGADGPPGADAALLHALPHRQLQVQERHSLHDKHDEVGDQETACGRPELRSGRRCQTGRAAPPTL